MTEKILKGLRLIDLLADLPDPFLTHLVRFSMLRQIHAGETIFCQGEPSPYCFGIMSGQVTIQRVPREKNFPPKILSVLGAGSLFGEQSLFKESPRTATATASQNGELIAIQGKQFRDWIEKDAAAGTPLVMGVLQNTLSRLRQTSHELSLVYGVGRYLATEKPIQERLQETVGFLRASLENIDEIIVYRKSPYWEEFEPLVTLAEGQAPAIPLEHPLVKQLAAVMKATVVEFKGNVATALIPFLDPLAPENPLHGFLWVASKRCSTTFSPNILLLLEAVSVQLTEALLRQGRQDDSEAQSRLRQSRQSFTL